MKSIELSLIDEISKEHIENIVEDISEVALDAILKDGILKDLPAIGIIVSLIKTSNNIREKIFAKKLLKFLYTLKDIPIEKRLEFINRIEEKEGFKQKVGETIIVLLEQLDNLDKPTIIGNLFKAYMLQNLTFSEFSKIASSVHRINIDDLLLFSRYHIQKKILPSIIKENLAFNGLMSVSIGDKPLLASMNKIHQELEYEINTFGKKFIEYGLLNKYTT